MADNLLTMTIRQDTLDKYEERFTQGHKKQARISLNNIKREWQAEFVRQDASMQSEWTPLKTWVTREGGKVRKPRKGTKIDPKSYAARKKLAYFSGKTKGGKVRYLRILKRTGIMLDRYIKGIRVDNIDYSVSINFPKNTEKDDVGIRAEVHAGKRKLPFGVLSSRPYDINRFRTIARNEIKESLAKK